MSGPWLPLWVRVNGVEGTAFEGLHEGVPAHMRTSLLRWSSDQLERLLNRHLTNEGAVLVMLEQVLRTELPPRGFAGLLARMREDSAEFALGVAELLGVLSGDDQAERLEAILLQCGSAWMVSSTSGSPQLVRRLGAGVEEAVVHALEPGDRAGEDLRKAFTHAFGRSANPEASHQASVKATKGAQTSIA